MNKYEEEEDVPKVTKKDSKKTLDNVKTQFSDQSDNQAGRRESKPRKAKKKLDKFFEDEAEEGESSEEAIVSNMQFSQKVIKKQESQVQIRPKVSEQWIRQFDGKSEEEVNKFFQRKFLKKLEEEREQVRPGISDPKLFCFRVKPNEQVNILFALSQRLISNQSKFKQEEEGEETKPTKISNIVSFLFLKKKKGFLFAEAYNINDVKSYLKGKFNIKQDSIVKITEQDYDVLFKNHKEERMNEHELGNYVRVTKGVYEGDLGRICGLRKSDLTLLLVPRINMSQIYLKHQIKNQENKNAVAILNHRPKQTVERPPRMPITNLQHIQFLKQFKTVITKDGLIKLTFKYNQVTTDVGPLHPKEIAYFNIDEDFLEFLHKQSKMITKKVDFKVGSLVQITEGPNAGKKGIISKIDSQIVIVTLKDKASITVPISNVRLIFGKGDYVVVVSGSDIGKEGIVLMNEGPQTTILTTNDHTIKVLTSCLGRRFGSEYVAETPAIQVKKFDLINYRKAVGIVLISTVHTILTLSISNTLQTISPLEVLAILQDRNNFTVNQYKEEINNQSTVKIVTGRYEGKICEVKHVHSQKAFLFHKDFIMTHNIWVEDITNLRPITTGNRLMNKGPRQRELVGKTVVIQKGIYKGFQGIIKHILGEQIKILLSAKRIVVEITKSCLSENTLNPMKTEESIPDIQKTPHYNIETRTYEIFENELSP